MAKSPRDYGLPEGYWDDKTETLSQAIGYFLVCFGRLELTITATLCAVLGYDNDYEKFGILTNGLDAGSKLTRLNIACARYGVAIGPNLKAAFAKFKRTDCAIRNKICHSWPTLDDKDTAHFGELRAVPEYLGRGPARPLRLDPSAYSIGHIYERAMWMQFLNAQLIRAGRIRPIVSLEVDGTNLGLPPDSPAHDKAAPPTKIDKRALKAQRKLLRKPRA